MYKLDTFSQVHFWTTLHIFFKYVIILFFFITMEYYKGSFKLFRFCFKQISRNGNRKKPKIQIKCAL